MYVLYAKFLACVSDIGSQYYQAVEIHAAHGYLLHSTLSAATNSLPAPYSGSLLNRMRLLLELAALTRAALPDSMPLLVRIPGSDLMEWDPSANGRDVDQCIKLSLALSELGVDFLDVSSGGLMAALKVVSGPGYQTAFSRAVRKALRDNGLEKNTKVGAVGVITSGVQAEELLQSGAADAVLVARGFQKNPGLV
jgi:2,4-dienoyl-CoA reductase-like NADH-dependent reductase (Old Yellow Enzyme family)